MGCAVSAQVSASSRDRSSASTSDRSRHPGRSRIPFSLPQFTRNREAQGRVGNDALGARVPGQSLVSHEESAGDEVCWAHGEDSRSGRMFGSARRSYGGEASTLAAAATSSSAFELVLPSRAGTEGKTRNALTVVPPSASGGGADGPRGVHGRPRLPGAVRFGACRAHRCARRGCAARRDRSREGDHPRLVDDAPGSPARVARREGRLREPRPQDRAGPYSRGPRRASDRRGRAFPDEPARGVRERHRDGRQAPQFDRLRRRLEPGGPRPPRDLGARRLGGDAPGDRVLGRLARGGSRGAARHARLAPRGAGAQLRPAPRRAAPARHRAEERCAPGEDSRARERAQADGARLGAPGEPGEGSAPVHARLDPEPRASDRPEHSPPRRPLRRGLRGP